jgi:hypothetical protein
VFLDRMDRYDVRVRQGRGGASLPEEPVTCGPVGSERRRENLDRDGSVERHIPSEKDHAHPAAPEFPIQRVATGYDPLKAEKLGCGTGHQDAPETGRRR